jgi:hypothetical protein
MTLQLPDSLAPWRRELSLFPPELAIELGGMVRRLASAIGPPIAARHRGDDPDGYDGIAHTGPYDRMLQSEWLLADEMPDEFLRRAIMREQLFFRIARRSPLDELLSVALFDAGPTQIGAPRVVHLALLIVLSQRCAERGGKFRWAVLQEHPRRINDRLDTDAVQALLALRSAREVDEATLDEWNDLLPHGDGRHRETWMIGGSRLSRLIERHARASAQGRDFRESSVVSIEEPLDLDHRVLQTRIHRGSGRIQELTLPLPKEDATVRLLRDPFSGSVRAVTRVAEVPTEFFFAAEGRQLIGREKEGGVVLHKIGHGNRPKVYGPYCGNRVIAAGAGRKQGASLSITHSGDLVFGAIHRQGLKTLLKVPASFPSGEENQDSPLRAMFPKSQYAHDYLFTDVRGNCWMTQEENRTIVRITDHVAAMTTWEGTPYLARMRGEWQIEKIDRDSPRVVARYPGSGTRAFFGRPAEDARYAGILMALEEGPDRWSVISADSVLHTNTCPHDARVIGVVAFGRSDHASLVYVDKFSIFLSHVTSLDTVVKTSLPIDAAVVDPQGPRVAYLSGGELVVYALDERKVIHRAGSRS